MKQALFTLIMIGSCICSFGQKAYNWEYMDNVYNRPAEVIVGYMSEIANEVKYLYLGKHIDSSSVTTKQYPRDSVFYFEIPFGLTQNERFCIGEMVLYPKFRFEAKYGRFKCEIESIRYEITEAGKGVCAKTGDLKDLKGSDCCKTFSNINTFLSTTLYDLRVDIKKGMIKHTRQW